MKKFLTFITAFALPILVTAEDIEIYVGNNSTSTNERHKVLIIFDNSGSMSDTQEVKQSYDPDVEYPISKGSDNALSERFLYFTKGGLDGGSLPVPDSQNEHRRFLEEINSCQIARDRIDQYGYFTGYIKEYSFSGQKGSWQELPDNEGANIEIIDCWEDIDRENPANAGIDKDDVKLPDGYPADNLGDKKNPIYHTSNINDASDNLKTGDLITLYSDNYLRWYYNEEIQLENKSRLEIAQEVVTEIVATTPSFDFGLQIFNINAWDEGDRDGGRVVHGIQESTPAAQQDLIDIINLKLDPETNTPLCETYYEAIRYFGGLSVEFGDDDSNLGNFYKGNTPPRDTSIESGGTYITPFDGCSDDVFVIMITDGKPTVDKSADTAILGLANDFIEGIDDEDKVAPGAFSVDGVDSYLPRLAWWARHNDINQSLEGDQKATFFSIGFDLVDANKMDPDHADYDPDYTPPDEVLMLQKAAEVGKGEYRDASNPEGLTEAIREFLDNIAKRNTTFTAPSVASNNFDRTETLTSVYYAMFSPSANPRWQGNLKKLEISSGGLVDRNGNPAIDDNNNIKEDASTFWSDVKGDGPDVASGGVVDMFASMDPDKRAVYSDLGSNGTLALFTKANAISTNAFGSTEALAIALDVTEDQIDAHINWALGYDVDNDDADADGDTTDMRQDVFGDPLHSKPLVINYGGESESSQDVRIFVGTNAGALHAFDDQEDTIVENWAFMPKEFFGNIEVLRSNDVSTKVYGIDGTPVSYTYDQNNDGKISSVDGDKAWVFFGLRRGGSSYYALDVSNKDSAPKLLWHINESSEGFEELGQTWSTPTVAYSLINISGNKAKPVLIFGGGYDPAKDASGAGGADNVGRGIFMVDAETGKLLWSIKAGDSGFDITDSIPSSVAILDSDSDGFVDRLYVGDTGANLWRIDMPGSDTADWQASKLAYVGHDSVEDEDLRFFSEPTIVRALIAETYEHKETVDGETTTTVHRTQTPYDAILIGSGDRTSPLSSNTSDKIFMIKDENILTQKFASIPATIGISDLYDYTSNPFQGLTEGSAAFNSLAIKVSQKSGWFIDLVGSEEKALTKPEAIAGVAYYSTFIPTSSADVCKVDGGTSQIYAVDLALGISIYDERIIQHANTIQDELTLVTLPDDPDNPDTDKPSNEPDSPGVVLLIGDTLNLCDANGNCEPLKFKTMRTNVVIAEEGN